MRYFKNEVFEDGALVRSEDVAWTRNDYVMAIWEIESGITVRRLTDAALSDEGRTWLEQTKERIDALRSEMLDL